MKRYDKLILEKLLTKYENSLISRDVNVHRQNIWFNVTEKSIPEYFDLTSVAYESVNRDAYALAMAGLVNLVWKNNIEDHILEKVKLNLSTVEKAYAYLGRNAKNDQIAKLFNYMDRQTNVCIPVCQCFEYIRQRISSGLSVKKYVDLYNLPRFFDVIKGTNAVLSNEKECFEREFSMSVYGDSKRFEQLKSSIKALLVEFGEEGRESVFSDYGILEKPSTVLIKGCAKALIHGATLELSALSQGIGFAGDDLSTIKWIDDDGANPNAKVYRIITIENLTAFYRFSCENAIIIYLGGFSNRVRVKLLEELHQAYPMALLYHFGDIDLGGFRILIDLRYKTGLEIQPLHMDVSILEGYRDKCRPLTVSDRAGLQKLVDELKRKADAGKALMEQEKIMTSSVEWMLANNLKLEQEIVVYEIVK